MAVASTYSKYEKRAVASLLCLSPPAIGQVAFSFNPETVVVTRRADVHTRGSASDNSGTPKGSTGSIFRKAPPAEISLTNVIIEGATTKANCDQLLNWMSPAGGALGALLGMAASVVMPKLGRGLASKLPELIFQWGPPMAGFTVHVVLKSCTVTYTRFNRLGIPIRAKVSLSLAEQPSLLSTLPTNPTSGGEPGRSTYRMTTGDNLQSVSVANYGSPRHWREVARVNDIDDPLRVRPGQVLYLPNPDELAERGHA